MIVNWITNLKEYTLNPIPKLNIVYEVHRHDVSHTPH